MLVAWVVAALVMVDIPELKAEAVLRTNAESVAVAVAVPEPLSVDVPESVTVSVDVAELSSVVVVIEAPVKEAPLPAVAVTLPVRNDISFDP